LPLNSKLWLFLCFLSAVSNLYSGGKAENEISAIDSEYKLCITEFDVSDLPPAQLTLGSILQNRFAARLRGVDHRVRSGPEIEACRQRAFSRARELVVTRLVSKRQERDDLLYKGYPRWKYKKELKLIESGIQKLEDELAETETSAWRVDPAPLFTLTETSFPPPPSPGEEDLFLDTQNADAFLSGKLTAYYGRIYVHLTLYSRDAAVTFEDGVIFSYEEMNAATADILDRVEQAVSGTARSALTVIARPENARILVNGKFAVNGEKTLVNPGPVSVSVSADGYENFSGTLDLVSGEDAETGVTLARVDSEILTLSLEDNGLSSEDGGLSPGEGGLPTEDSNLPSDEGGPSSDEGSLSLGDSSIFLPGGTRVYIGALYAGIIPEGGELEIAVPRDHYRYINVETEDGRTGEIIVLGAEEDGRQRFVEFAPAAVPGRDEKPVEKRRRQFYGAWGRLWIALPLAFLLDGIAQSYANAYNSSGTGNSGLYDRAQTSFYISRGAMITAGIFGAESLIRLVLYVSAASKEAVPLWE
jgi:hypothetical protein